MVLTGNTYYQGDSAITAMYQGNVLVYSAATTSTTTFYYVTTGGTIIPDTAFTGFVVISNTYSQGMGTLVVRGNVTYLGTAFQNKRNLEGIILPDSVLKIDIVSFYNCEKLSSVTINSGVTEIEQDAFSGCADLYELTYLGTKAQWNAISKSRWWNDNAPNLYVVHCTDGDIPVYYPPE
jgi:hypothetical protein